MFNGQKFQQQKMLNTNVIVENAFLTHIMSIFTIYKKKNLQQ